MSVSGRRGRAGCSAPRLPELLLNLLLPPGEGHAVSGDLNEEYELFVRPARGRLRADLWYWRQVVSSLAPALQRRRALRQRRRPKASLSRSRWRPDMDGFLLDLRLGLRMLRHRPGFTVIAVITLGLGIGANTAIFSIVHAVLLRPLPYSESDELMTLWLDNRIQGWHQDVTSYPNYMDWAEWNTTFDGMSAWSFTRQNLTGDGEPARLLGLVASPNLLQILGVDPVLGRAFTPADWQADHRVLVVSHGFWLRRFGQDPGAVGARLVLDGEPYTVVGIMPPGFNFGDPEVVYWRPFAPDVVEGSRRSLWLRVSGRLKSDATLAQARADMDRVGARLEEEYPDSNEGYGVTILPLHEHLVGDVSSALWILLGSVGLVLLIACANVANLGLARAFARESEMAVRSALGANRRRLLRQALVESVTLATLGAAAGAGLAFAGLGGLQALNPELPRSGEIAIDATVLGFTLVVGVATGLVFGLVPGWRAARPNMVGALKEGARGGGGGRRGHRLRAGLAIAEIALALTLLAGAGLLLRSYIELRRVDLGFEARNLLTTTISLPPGDYHEEAASRSFFDELLGRLAALPGVESAVGVDSPPLGPRFASGMFTIAGRPPVPREQMREVKFNTVTRGYFETMGIRRVAGTTFDGAESPDGSRHVVINETLRKLFFPDEDPLGQLFLFGRPEAYATEEDPDPELPWWTIVGVVGDVPQRGIRQPAEPEVFVPFAANVARTLTLLIRTTGDPTAVAGAVRAEVWAIDSDLPVTTQQPMSDVVDRASASERFNLRLLGIFALLALSLAAIGIYGVMAYGVAERTTELGIRMALGATASAVIGAVLRRALLVTAAGLTLGLGFTLSASGIISGLLYEVLATDPWTLAVVTLVLGVTSMAASLVPALRAVRIDPARSLRPE